jgi:hypothetical protein
MMPKSVTAAELVALLNEINKLDPSVIKHFVCDRIKCNEALANHPSVQVGVMKKVCPQCLGKKRVWADGWGGAIDTPEEGDCFTCKGTGLILAECEVGLVGILNGLFPREDGWGDIAVLMNEDGAVSGFELLENCKRV